MPLTPACLEAIRDECLADDVEIPAEAVAWTEEEACAFFESGGRELPRKPGLEGAEVLAYYEVRKPTVDSSSSAFLMDALHSALHLEDQLVDRGSGATEPEPGGLWEAVEALGGNLAELRALAITDRVALSEQLQALGYTKLGPRLQLENSLLAPPPVTEDGEHLLRSLGRGLASKWPAFKADGLVSVERMLRALEQDPESFDKQMALMGVRRPQRKLLVGALRQSTGAAASLLGGGAASNGDGYATEDESDFDFEEYAGSGVT